MRDHVDALSCAPSESLERRTSQTCRRRKARPTHARPKKDAARATTSTSTSGHWLRH